MKCLQGVSSPTDYRNKGSFLYVCLKIYKTRLGCGVFFTPEEYDRLEGLISDHLTFDCSRTVYL